jgi:hypothetical protein
MGNGILTGQLEFTICVTLSQPPIPSLDYGPLLGTILTVRPVGQQGLNVNSCPICGSDVT